MQHRINIVLFTLWCALGLGSLGCAESEAWELEDESNQLDVARTAENPFRHFIQRSAVLFSPRWVASAYTTREEYREVATEYGATHLVWHYPMDRSVRPAPFSSEMVEWGAERGMGIQCALPAITEDPRAACIDADSGEPVVLADGLRIYVPDTDSPAFRHEVTTWLERAHEAGCQFLQQDNVSMMVGRQDDGCYQDWTNLEVQQRVEAYYRWLRRRVRNTWGEDIPMTFNKYMGTANDSGNAYANYVPYFNGAMAELTPEYNHPAALLRNIHEINEERFDYSTITTLVDDSPLLNRRAIASVYALGGHPIVPFDIYINPRFRYFGPPSVYGDLYRFVRQHRNLFDGIGSWDAYVNHWQSQEGVIELRGGLRVASNKPHVLSTLRLDRGRRAIVHIVNWQVSEPDRFFTFWIDADELPRRFRECRATRGCVPSARFYTPESSEPVTLRARRYSGNRWGFTTPRFDLWGVVEVTVP